MGQEHIYEYLKAGKITGQILISLFHVLITFILFAVFVALITSKFTTYYSKCVAEASLLQASVVLQLEKRLSKKDKAKLSSYYKRFCNPMVSTKSTNKGFLDVFPRLSTLFIVERREYEQFFTISD